MNIRYAQEKDYERVSHLYWESDHFHFQNLPGIYKETKESFRDLNFYRQLLEDPKSLFLVLEIEGEVIGFIYGYEEQKGFLPFHKKRTYFYIDNIVIDSRVQDRGYGSMLIDNIIEECRNRNYSDIMINVYSFNQKAVSLYQKKGFTELSRDYILELRS